MSSDTLSIRTDSGQSMKVPAILPVVPLRGVVAYPYTMFPLVVNEPSVLELADEALAGSKMLALFSVRPSTDGLDFPPVDDESGGGSPDIPAGAPPSAGERLTEIGTVAHIQRMLRFPDGGMRLLVQGVARVRRLEMVQETPFLKARVALVKSRRTRGRRVEALRRNAVELFQQLVDSTGYLSEELKVVALNIDETGRLADFLGANLNLSLTDKQALLEEVDSATRLEMVTGFMVRELDILTLGRQIQEQVQTEMNAHQREFFLRQQLKAIRKELGEGDDDSETEDLRAKVEEAHMPEEAKEATLREVERLARMSPQAADYTVAKNYVDWMLSVPWNSVDRPAIDVARASQVLDEDHYGLEEVKERILEYLAVRRLKPDTKSPILSLTGPPGVGKTSLGKSIARALGRPFVRLALGGLHDEAEIRGHRRTYIGAMPGRIIQGMVTAKAPDPVFMMDEIDKVGADFRGDPTSALLEVLDPEQNNTFQDNYLNVHYDLSRVLFLTTANALYSIPGPLRDRMEVIELPGYVTAEKVEIAKRYLVPKALEENGITKRHLTLRKSALVSIANDYTREAGVRNLERQIHRVARKVAVKVARGKRPRLSLTREDLTPFLGKPRVFREGRGTRSRIGVVTGMAWTPFGGEILFIEATAMSGRGQLILTGQLGSVMQESARTALSYVRANLKDFGIKDNPFEGKDIHIHVPAGAMPKDGPSAGVAMVSALASLVTRRKVRVDTAMTGEISLRGGVLPIGGLKQKVLGAKRAGIKRIMYPAANQADWEEIPEDLTASLEAVPVENIQDVIAGALLEGRSRS